MKIIVPPLTDPGSMPLREFQRIVDSLVLHYPSDAIIEFDAGYNNISCTIDHPSITAEYPPCT